MTLLAFAPFVCALALTLDEPQFSASAAPTRFSAANTSANTQLLLLGDPAHGARAQMLIAPGASFETFFPSDTLNGLYLEVVSFTPQGRKASGAVSFAQVLASGVDSLTVEISQGQSLPWLHSGLLRNSVASEQTLVPSSVLLDCPTSTAPIILEPTHAPVITPDDVITNNIAPRIHKLDPSI